MVYARLKILRTRLAIDNNINAETLIRSNRSKASIKTNHNRSIAKDILQSMSLYFCTNFT